jgi:hypothetical protein
MSERTTVRLPGELVLRAKQKAAAAGVSLTALIEERLRRVVNDTPYVSETPRVLPPVACAMGGVLPGVDLDDSAALEDSDDRADR